MLAFSQLSANDNWSSGYIGKLSFDLKEDPRLVEKTRSVHTIAQQLRSVEQKLKIKRNALKKAKKVQASAKGAVNSTTKQLANNKKSLKNLQASVPKLKAAVSSTQRNLKQATESVRVAKVEVNKLVTRVSKLQQQVTVAVKSCNAKPTPACQNNVKTLQDKLRKAKLSKAAKDKAYKVAVSNLNRAKSRAATAKSSLNTTNANIVSTKKKINTLNAQLAGQKNKLKSAVAQVKRAQSELNPITSKFNRVTAQHSAAKSERQLYRQKLITRIMQVNARGADAGHRDGVDDGHYYADLIGVDEGRRDGDFDGEDDGRAAGLSREFNTGAAQGKIEGEELARDNGERDGSREGTTAGNISAATSAGESAGTSRANSSDATTVGTAQGAKDGFARAQYEGKIEGFQIGKAQGIKRFEDLELKEITVPGKFIGTFSSNIPSYPGFNCSDARRVGSNNICPQYNPRQRAVMNMNRHVVKRAFIDGYIKRYRHGRRNAFVRVIADIYLSVYDNTYRSSFNYYSNLSYPQERERGRLVGHDRAYNRLYPIVRADFFAKFKEMFDASPNRSASEYVQTYARVEKESFERVYEAIRLATYKKVEQATFDKNIAAQVEKFRVERLAQVTKIYKENPVLKYESSSLFDSGISGIAKNDGVFQPGEDVIHTIIVKNFGLVAQNGAKVKLTSGATITLPSIPAQSTVTVKGAAKSHIGSSTAIHSAKTLGLIVQGTLKVEKAIQGRHFCSIAKLEVNCIDRKKIAVEFPLNLTNLTSKSTLLLGTTNNLSINVSNNSKRVYTGPLKINLTVNSNSDVITQEFDTIDALKNVVTLKSAKVQITDESDVYTPLAFKAVIKKGGVTLGILEHDFNTMAKAAFINKAGQSVIVVNSDSDTDSLLSVIDQFGGVVNVGVLDISLSNINSTIFAKGLVSKKVIAVGNSANSGVNDLLKNSINSIFFALSRGEFSSIKQQPSLKNSYRLPVVLDGLAKNQEMIFSNQQLAGVRSMNIVTQISDRNIKNTVKKFNNFTQSDAQLLESIKKTMNKTSFFQSNSLMKSVNLQVLGELMTVNRSYSASGRSDSIANIIENGKSLLFHKILASAGTKASSSKIGIQMTAITMNHILRKLEREFTPMSEVVAFKIGNRIRGRLNDTMGSTLLWAKKKLLKNFKKMDKGTYRALAKKETVNLPLDLVTYFDEDSRQDEI